MKALPPPGRDSTQISPQRSSSPYRTVIRWSDGEFLKASKFSCKQVYGSSDEVYPDSRASRSRPLFIACIVERGQTAPEISDEEAYKFFARIINSKDLAASS